MSPPPIVLSSLLFVFLCCLSNSFVLCSQWNSRWLREVVLNQNYSVLPVSSLSDCQSIHFLGY